MLSSKDSEGAGLLSAVLESIAKGNKSGSSPTIMIIHAGDEPVTGYDPEMSDDEVVARNDRMIQAAARMRQAAHGGDDEGEADLNDPMEDLEPSEEEIGAHGPTIGRQPNGFPVKAAGAIKIGVAPAPGKSKLEVPKVGSAKSAKSSGPKAPSPKASRK